MIALFKYHSPIMGTQISVRAGNAQLLAYQIFFRDGLKMLLDQGYNSKSKKIKTQFEYAERVYQSQCNGTITLEMIQNFSFDTDLGGFSCLCYATNSEEIEILYQVVIDITKDRVNISSHNQNNISNVLALLQEAQKGESQSLWDAINQIHHI